MKEETRGFSLVELLVAMALVSVLAAALLPSVERSLELARRGVCANNLRQLHMTAALYADDYSGFLPTSHDVNRSSSLNAAAGSSRFRTAEFCAWNVLVIDLAYCGWELVACPSMTVPPDFTFHTGRSHYGYPYNGWTAQAYCDAGLKYRRNALADAGRGQRVLFQEAAEERLTGDYAYSLVTTGPTQWAHADGGNMVSHAGSVRYVANHFEAWGYYSWPTNAWTFQYRFVHVDDLP